MKKLLSVLLASAMILSLFAGVGFAEGTDTIVIGITGDATYLEPNGPAVGGTEGHVTSQIYEGLVQMNEDDTEIVGCLASDWTISEDGMVYTFNLVPGIVFSNGTPVKGEDWVWSLYRARDTETSEYAFIAECIDTVEATDAQVVITLKSPTMSFLAQLCSFNMILGCKAYAENLGEDAYLASPMGTGPYMLKEWNRGNYILLEKNPNYRYADTVATQYVKFQVVSDDNTRLLQLQSGQIDMMGDVPASLMSVIENTDGLQLDLYPSTQIRYLLLNTTKAPFDDPAVREALVYGLDKAQLAEVIYGENGAPVASCLSENHGKYFNSDLQVIPYSPDQAKEILAAAGYTKDVEFTFSISAGSEVYEQIAILLKSSLDQAGFNVTIERVEGNMLYSYAQENTLQACCFQWFDDYYDPSEVLGWICDFDQSSAWFSFLEDTELDAMQAAALIEQDPATRVQMYWDIQQRISENNNVIPLFRNSFTYAYSTKLQGVHVNAFNVYFCDLMSKAE